MSDSTTPKTDDLAAAATELVKAQCAKDPWKVLVAVQLSVEQEEHINHAFQGKVRRRLVPLPVLAELIEDYNSNR